MNNIERRSIISNYFPEHLYNNQEYRVFIDIVANLMGDWLDLIEVFPDIVNIEKIVDRMLPHLSTNLGYSYNESKDAEVQREVLKRIINSYKDRGTLRSIINAAELANSEDWIRSNLTYYNGSSNREYAELVNMNDSIFRLSNGQFSSKDKLYDGLIYTAGVYRLKHENITQAVRDKVEEVRQAGVRINYVNMTYLRDDNDPTAMSMKYSDWGLTSEFYRKIYLFPGNQSTDALILDRDALSSGKVFSGTDSVQVTTKLKSEFYASGSVPRDAYGSINFNSVPIEDLKSLDRVRVIDPYRTYYKFFSELNWYDKLVVYENGIPTLKDFGSVEFKDVVANVRKANCDSMTALKEYQRVHDYNIVFTRMDGDATVHKKFLKDTTDADMLLLERDVFKWKSELSSDDRLKIYYEPDSGYTEPLLRPFTWASMPMHSVVKVEYDKTRSIYCKLKDVAITDRILTDSGYKLVSEIKGNDLGIKTYELDPEVGETIYPYTYNDYKDPVQLDMELKVCKNGSCTLM